MEEHFYDPEIKSGESILFLCSIYFHKSTVEWEVLVYSTKGIINVYGWIRPCTMIVCRTFHSRRLRYFTTFLGRHSRPQCVHGCRKRSPYVYGGRKRRVFMVNVYDYRNLSLTTVYSDSKWTLQTAAVFRRISLGYGRSRPRVIDLGTRASLDQLIYPWFTYRIDALSKSYRILNFRTIFSYLFTKVSTLRWSREVSSTNKLQTWSSLARSHFTNQMQSMFYHL